MAKILLFSFLLFTSFSLRAQDFWESVGNIGSHAYCFTVDSAGNIHAGAGNGIYKSTDDGITWVRKSQRGGIWFALNKQGNMFLGTHSNTLMKSIDNGETWSQLTTLAHQDVRPSFFLSNGDFLAFSYSGGLFRSTDNGQTWSQEYVDSVNVVHVWSFATSEIGDIFAATDHFIYISNDLGYTWEQINFDTLCPDVRALLITKKGDIYAGSKSMKCGIFKSTDHGNTWTQVFQGLDLVNYQFIFNMVESVNGWLFASTDADGVYMSKDGGKTAIKLSTGLPDTVTVNCWQVFISPGGHLFVGTSTYGIYRSTELVTDVPDNGDFKFQKVNFPEVTDNSFQINFTFPVTNEIQADIFDVTGRNVLSAKFNSMQIEENSINISTEQLRQGVYFYRIISGKNILSGKFLKLKS